MAYRIKCPECNTCMVAVWVENNRYWHCWLCKSYYAGRNDDLKLVKDPYTDLNRPKDIEKDDLK